MEDGRLNRDAWLSAALRALAEQGFPALKPDSLARRLGVSRGSFYWHFANVAAFHEAVLDAWEAAAVDDPLRRSHDEERVSDRDGLRRLIVLAFTAPSELERAVHRWAASYAPAAARIARVNARRIDLLTAMFARLGCTDGLARARGRMLYWAFVGRVLSDDDSVDVDLIGEIDARLGAGAVLGSASTA